MLPLEFGGKGVYRYVWKEERGKMGWHNQEGCGFEHVTICNADMISSCALNTKSWAGQQGIWPLSLTLHDCVIIEHLKLGSIGCYSIG